MNLKVTLAIVVSTFTLLFLILFGGNNTSPIIQETLQITPKTDSSLITNNLFSGGVNITISGYITSSITDERADAYYRFNESGEVFGLDSDTLLTLNDNLLLPPNGGGFAPSYSSEHIYTFSYFVGNSEKHLEFSLVPDEFRSYNGFIEIEIVTIPNYGGR